MMTISNETVLNKMMEELQAAKRSMNNNDEMITCISKVKVLSELILDEYNEKSKSDIQKDKSDKSNSHISEIQHMKKNSDSSIIEDNETSIFDF